MADSKFQIQIFSEFDIIFFLQGVDPEYDKALDKFYTPYHDFIDTMFRLAVNNESVQEVLINLSAVVGFEAVPLHSTYFPKLWLDILKAQVGIFMSFV